MLCLRKVSVGAASLLTPHAQICTQHTCPGTASKATWPSVCHFCSPVPSISWRRADGNPLPGKIKINHSTGVLEIPYFRPEDAGVYECVAENSRGLNVARGQLLFQSKNPAQSDLFILVSFNSLLFPIILWSSCMYIKRIEVTHWKGALPSDKNGF